MKRFYAMCWSAMAAFVHCTFIVVATTAMICSHVNGQPPAEATTLVGSSSTLAQPKSPAAEPEIPGLSQAELRRVMDFQNHRIDAIDQVIRSVVAIYGEDRGGGGSGVVITPTGLALTNHHVIIGAGVEGWGGMAGNKMYRWKLIGTDPGGDVSLIQLLPGDRKNKDTDDGPVGESDSDEGDGDNRAAPFAFPFTPLGDSDTVNVGDWALAMGNPFILTEDQSPTVTLGIVSGVNRYQSGAGKNQLVYGNCIQVDSSINPGNSGGPLFNFSGEVIGINGRGSFQDRGRVNVGLGYAISANQIKHFVPELLATKLVEHGTLDANFSDRGGKVVCSTLSVDSPIAQAGLELGDEMLEFENKSITTANQFTNLICTLPEGWPARLKIRKSTGQEMDLQVRLLGLPYSRPPQPQKTPPAKRRNAKDGPSPPNEQQKAQQRKLEMVKLLSAKPGTVRNKKSNRTYADLLLRQWRPALLRESKTRCWKLEDSITLPDDDAQPQTMTTWISTDGRFRVQTRDRHWHFDGEDFFESVVSDGERVTHTISVTQAHERIETLQAIVMLAGFQEPGFSDLGDVLIDGADLSNGQLAWRLVVDDHDNPPLYAWFNGTMFSDNQLELSKCSTDIDCEAGGVLLSDWKTVDEAKQVEFPMTRQSVFGLSEEVRQTISNVRISEISVPEFDSLFSDQLSQEAGSNE